MNGTSLSEGSPANLARRIVEVHADDAGWLDRFAEELGRQRAGAELRRVLDGWGLSQSAAARLFGVSRQGLSKWLSSGVPQERALAMADLGAATDLLVHYLRRDRIPGVVRRPAEMLGGRSLLDLLGAGDTAGVLAACERMFDFARVQG